MLTKRCSPFVTIIQSKLAQIDDYIRDNAIFRIVSNESEKNRSEFIKYYREVDKNKMLVDKWMYLKEAWELKSTIKEFYELIEIDYLELIRLYSYKLTSELRVKK